jgi:hypothetical protein
VNAGALAPWADVVQTPHGAPAFTRMTGASSRGDGDRAMEHEVQSAPP